MRPDQTADHSQSCHRDQEGADQFQGRTKGTTVEEKTKRKRKKKIMILINFLWNDQKASNERAAHEVGSLGPPDEVLFHKIVIQSLIKNHQIHGAIRHGHYGKDHPGHQGLEQPRNRHTGLEGLQ